MAQPPPNVFKKDIVANAATLPPSHPPHVAASSAASNASPSNHILPTSALMAGLCVLVMALAMKNENDTLGSELAAVTLSGDNAVKGAAAKLTW